MKLIVGLGNIGPQYAHTRHNIGFMTVDELALRHADSDWKIEPKLKAAITTFTEEDTGEKIILAKPQTMMNLSGEAVQRLMQFYKIAPADVWIIFDELDVPFGRLRIRLSGSAGGHQGVKSVIQHIGEHFVRVRIGISLNDRATEPSEVYVLRPFNADEQPHLPHVIAAAAIIVADELANDTPREATHVFL